ncbi:MAG: cytochrome d ubiquinol oxidase subunit II, partial [Actinomycetota bacterium]|nr:cytochrome d ubiquinol oxidase subunit II [Actinomycetota bacterium]
MTGASLALLVAVVAAFTGLDGIGRGSALRAVTGTAGRDRDRVLATAGPQLLLGHVWMVAAAGLMVGLFPRWEGAVVGHAYWWVLAIAAGLVLRVAALGVAVLGVPAADARPDAVRAALAGTGALATA